MSAAARILLVHDDPDVAVILESELRNAGWTDIVTAHDGEQGLRAATSLLPHLVIADVHMPGLDGFQLLRILQSGDGPKIPVILVSASFRDPAAARLAGDLGAAAYLEGPWEPGRLHREVHRVLAERRSTMERTARAPVSARILVVEDEPDVATVVQLTLRSRGYEVEWVDNGRDVPARVREFRPDLLVLDNQLPGATGLEVLKQLRADGYDVGAVVLTAHADVPLSVQFMRHGAEDVLSKPFESGPLLASIGRALERRALHLRATQFRERLEAVRRSEARCRSLVELSRDVILRLDPAARLVEASPATADFAGVLRDQLIGREAASLLTEDSHAAFARACTPAAAGEELEVNLRSRDGEAVPLSIRVQALRERDELVGYWVVGRDLRRQRQLQRRLVDAEKRSGIVRLVGGISHEFSGLVGAMLGNAQLGLRSGDVRETNVCLRQIEQSAVRAADLLGDLRRIAWDDGGSAVADAGAVTRQRLELERPRFDAAGVPLIVSQVTPLPAVTASPDGLSRALAELLSNARHACIEAGPRRSVRVSVSVLGDDRVEWLVEDEGGGIPEADLPSVFDPFFTTKGSLGGDVFDDKLHGTGLGLAIARALSDANGGRLTVEPRAGGGTVARLILPVRRESDVAGPAVVPVGE